jgi:hypothetical protein
MERTEDDVMSRLTSSQVNLAKVGNLGSDLSPTGPCRLPATIARLLRAPPPPWPTVSRSAIITPSGQTSQVPARALARVRFSRIHGRQAVALVSGGLFHRTPPPRLQRFFSFFRFAAFLLSARRRHRRTRGTPKSRRATTTRRDTRRDLYQRNSNPKLMP